jgi:hypothetical protein
MTQMKHAVRKFDLKMHLADIPHFDEAISVELWHCISSAEDTFRDVEQVEHLLL